MVKRKQGLVPVPRLGLQKRAKPGSGPGSGSQARENRKALQSPDPNASRRGPARVETGGGSKGGTGPRDDGERAGNAAGESTHARADGSLQGSARERDGGRSLKRGAGGNSSGGQGDSRGGRGGDERRGNRARQNQRIYRQAATALTRCLAADASKRGGASLKSLTLAPQNVAKKATHALTCQTLKLLPLLQLVLTMAGVLEVPAGQGRGPDSGRGLRGGRDGARGRSRGGGGGRGSTRGACGGAGKGLWAELVYVVAYDVLFGNAQAAAAALGGRHDESRGQSGGKKKSSDGVGTAGGGSRGKVAISGGQSAEVRAVLSHRSALQAALARLVVREGVPSVDHLVLRLCGPGAGVGAGEGPGPGTGAEGQQSSGAHPGLAFPRYARVNTLKTSLAEALRALSGGVHPGGTAGAQESSLWEGPAGEPTLGPGTEQGEVRGGEGGAGAEERGGRGGEGQHQQEQGNGHVQHRGSGGAQRGGAAQPAWGVPEVDPLIPNLLRFPPGADLHAHPLVRRGHIILQGRASCIPAHVLGPPCGAHVVDACAAPGNKTTHLAAVMGGQGRVIACERDPKRAQLLRASVERAGAGGVVDVVVGNFLSLDPREKQFARVKAVLVDPSCSGSGTALSRLDHLLPSSRQQAMASLQAEAPVQGGTGEEDEEREGEGAWDRDGDEEKGAERQAGDSAAGSKPGLGARGNGSQQGAGDPGEQQHRARLEGLARFQEAALRHALGFPGAERVVYSTCSVEERENEGVVARVLGHARDLGFQLARALPGWPRRGLDKYEFADMVLRTRPEEDLMDGFFVALFTRDLKKRKRETGAREQEETGAVEEEVTGAREQEETGAVEEEVTGAGREREGPAADSAGIAGVNGMAQNQRKKKKKDKKKLKPHLAVA